LGQITLKPIGRVRNSIRTKKREGWETVVSRIELCPKYAKALEGIEEYSHLMILFWLSRVPSAARGKILKIHPRSRPDLPLVGLFATRTQYRPNPIGLTQVQLLGSKSNILTVKGLDALNGTPVIDIKPISPKTDIKARFRVPGWYYRLWKTPSKRKGERPIREREG